MVLLLLLGVVCFLFVCLFVFREEDVGLFFFPPLFPPPRPFAIVRSGVLFFFCIIPLGVVLVMTAENNSRWFRLGIHFFYIFASRLPSGMLTVSTPRTIPSDFNAEHRLLNEACCIPSRHWRPTSTRNSRRSCWRSYSRSSILLAKHSNSFFGSISVGKRSVVHVWKMTFGPSVRFKLQ